MDNQNMPNMLSDEQLQHLADILSARNEAVVKDRFTLLLQKLDSIQKCIDIFADNADTDHQDFSQMKIAMSSIEQSQKEIIALMNHNTKKTVERMGEKTEQVMEQAVSRVAEAVEPVMAEAVQKLNNGVPLNQKRPFWRFWRR